MLANADELSVVLVDVRNPLNIGAAARAMSNFGFLSLRVVNPYDVAFRDARSAMAAAPVLADATEYTSLAEAVADCSLVIGTTAAQNRELQLPLLPLQDGVGTLRKHLTAGRAALVFGSEKTGLSNDDLSHCHWLMHIPTRQQHLSMNLGQAVAICLYEIAREGSSHVQPDSAIVGATAAEIERVTSGLLEALAISGYVNANAQSATETRIRHLVHRLNLSAEDANVWMGMLRQILWKLKDGSEDRG
jgi:TrmH family RNA methyltransferase